MIIVFFLMVGIGLLVLQTSLLPLLPDWLGRPDLLFILIVYAALRLETYHGAVLILFFGLLLDIFSGPFLGLYPMIFLMLFVVLKTLAVNLAIHESVHQVPLTLTSFLFASSALYLFASLLLPENTIIWSWRGILLQLLMLAIFTIPLFNFFDLLRTRFRRRQRSYSSLQIQSGNRLKP
jgi:rod shape-determining protein MreD